MIKAILVILIKKTFKIKSKTNKKHLISRLLFKKNQINTTKYEKMKYSCNTTKFKTKTY